METTWAFQSAVYLGEMTPVIYDQRMRYYFRAENRGRRYKEINFWWSSVRINYD